MMMNAIQSATAARLCTPVLAIAWNIRLLEGIRFVMKGGVVY